ncbi:PIR Superfamily Protein [Plasmodium malariae]|uniref:PIR Superfamily Protein n=1 Tax=Plasmodium malariae TaxID=5858 RepID=A0A1A8WL33_PLAMA|nr:PIR Superfamily Protein [Plasmodium malariae]
MAHKDNVNRDRCNDATKYYTFYIKHYTGCKENIIDEFFEELKNFKKVYDNQMRKINACPNVPRILEPTENYIFVVTLTTVSILIASFTLFILYKFTPMKVLLHSYLIKKKIHRINSLEEIRR